MKWVEAEDSGMGAPVLELTRRNLEVLLAKLDDPMSARTIGEGGGRVWARAVENEEHYASRAPGPMRMPSTGETL